MTGSFRASDADRDQVLEVLHAAYAEGRITYDEHAERAEAVTKAKTFDDLTPLTADLVPAPLPATVSRGAVARPSGEPDRVVSVLATGKRVGPWQVRSNTAAITCLGDALIDLTEATFDSQRIEINCAQLLGSTKVRVRPGTTVVVDAVNIMGDSSVKDIGEPDPSMPTVVIKGFNILGDIQVRGPKKPPPWKRHVA